MYTKKYIHTQVCTGYWITVPEVTLAGGHSRICNNSALSQTEVTTLIKILSVGEIESLRLGIVDKGDGRQQVQSTGFLGS